MGARDHLLSFVGPTLAAARWKQFRAYFVDVAPGRSGWNGANLLSGTGSSAAPMNGYPKVFNIEADPREQFIGSEWHAFRSNNKIDTLNSFTFHLLLNLMTFDRLSKRLIKLESNSFLWHVHSKNGGVLSHLT